MRTPHEPALGANVLPRLSFEDPWLFNKIHKYEIPINSYLGSNGDCYNPSANCKNIEKFIIKHIDNNAYLVRDYSIIRGLDNINYYPKEDRFFIECPDMKRATHILVYLLSKFPYFKFPSMIQWKETAKLIQVLLPT
jgi:hypothetical protein